MANISKANKANGKANTAKNGVKSTQIPLTICFAYLSTPVKY